MKKFYFDQYTQSTNKLFLFRIIFSITDLNFLKTGFGMLFNSYGTVVGKPSFWQDLNDNYIAGLVDIKNHTGIDQSYWTLLNISKINNKTLRSIRILDMYYNYKDFYDSTVVLPYDISTSKVFIVLLLTKIIFFSSFLLE